jgi:hypothetical protein
VTDPMLAHIIGGGPVWPLWLTGALLFGGAVAAMAVPQALRRVCLGVAGVDAGTAAVNLDTGMHTVRVELVTSAHRAFAPPVLTDETITVSGIGPLSPPPDCPPAASSTP